MAALTESINVEEQHGVIADSPCAVDVIYRGALVMHNAAGFLAPCAAESGAVFAGIAEEEVDNSAGAAGDKNCKHIHDGRFLLTGAGFVQADVGEIVYASDDQTITKTAGSNVLVGKIQKFVSATQVWVLLENNPAPAA
ncbi:MAG: cytoplasmic protein [bacterium]|nr:cytoplasmic protein [bacterium]